MRSRAFAAILLWVASAGIACARDYYVSSAGDDANPGTQTQPWRSIAKVNGIDFEPGDRVHFQGGERFPGTITLDGSDSRLTVTSHGDGRAVIDAANGSALVAKGCDHLTVRNLSFVGSGRKDGNTADGVLILDAQGVTVEHVDVRGFQTSGLQMEGVRNARIAYVHARENGSAGISVGWHRRSEHIRISHCLAENNPGDPTNLTNHSGNGIVAANANDVVIEYCRAFHNGWDMPRKGNGPVGIWAWNVDRAVIQFCIAHDNKSPGDDGGGFDLDGGATNSLLQYNLSYNNDGPGYFLCQFPGASDFKNNVIRYNISHNDGVKNNRRSGIEVYSASPNASDCQVYNNTVYNRHGAAAGFGGLPMPNVVFRNNLFICTGDVIAGESKRGRFENNIYGSADGRPLSFDGHATIREWAEATGQEKVSGEIMGKRLDPKVVRAGEVMPTDPTKLADFAFYRLQADSPCRGAGIQIEDNGGRDFWGNPVPQDGRPTVGAHEGP
jgi:hypothetical protein